MLIFSEIIIILAVCCMALLGSGCSHTDTGAAPPALAPQEQPSAITEETAPHIVETQPSGKIPAKSSIPSEPEILKVPLQISAMPGDKAGREPAFNPPAASRMLMPGETTDRFLTDSAFVMKWMIKGPFEIVKDDKNSVIDMIHYEFEESEKSFDGIKNTPGMPQWQQHSFGGDQIPGCVSLKKVYPGISIPTVAYMVAFAYTPEELLNISLKTGSDDFLKIWINGKLIHTYNRVHRNAAIDQDTVEGIKFNKGYNRIVVKTFCMNPSAGWNIFIRFTAEKGLPVCLE